MLEDLLVGELVAINARQTLTVLLIIWIPLSLILILNRYFPSVIGLDDSDEVNTKQVAREDLTDDSDSSEIVIEQLDDEHAKAVVLDEKESIEQLDVEEFDQTEDGDSNPDTEELDLATASDDAHADATGDDIGEVDPELAEWFPVDETDDDSDSTDADDKSDDSDKAVSEDEDSDNTENEDTDSKPESLDSILDQLSLPSKVKLIDDAKATSAKAYSSSEYEAVEVGSKFADELEKLGFEIIPTGHSEAKAVRGNLALKMAITPENSDLTEGDDLVYPDLDDEAVVVQIWLED